MSAGLLPTTKMAIRAAVAALGAVLVAQLLELPRAYWVVTAAVVLITETWGDSIRKVLQRLGMTALGCLVGWLLYRLSAGLPAVEMAFLLASVFLAVFFRPGGPGGSYPGMIFFVTVYVVFLFAVLGQWSAEIVLARLYDTAVGCGVALVVALTVLPQRAARQMEGELPGLWALCGDHAEKAFARLLAPQDAGPGLAEDRLEVLRRLERLRQQYQAARYETLRRAGANRRRAEVMARADLLCRHVLSLGAVAEMNRGRPPVGLLEKELSLWGERLRAGFTRLLQGSAPVDVGEERREGDRLWERFRRRARELRDAGRVSRADLLLLSPLAYFAWKVDRLLLDVGPDGAG